MAWRSIVLLCCLADLVRAAAPNDWFVRPVVTSNRLNAVTFGNGLFLTAGEQGSFLSSSNGVDWKGGTAGPSRATFFGAAAAYSGLYLGGEGGLLKSTNFINWTQSVTVPASEAIYGILFYYDVFAFSYDAIAGRTILYRGQDSRWSTNALPTSNAVYAAAAPIAPGGIYLANLPYVAAGDRGTILTYAGGQWTPRESGTTVPLRAVALHQGRMFVGGDAGTVLSSGDGISWMRMAPTSFDIKGLASSGNALVAVGAYGETGRLQVSADGMGWPGEAVQFPKPLNAAAYGSATFVAVGDGGLVIQSGYAPDSTSNSWLKPTSGYWEEPFWSRGQLPVPYEAQVYFTNSGWKALAIGQNTTANFSNSLSVIGLDISAPEGSYNQLLLNYAGTNVLLSVSNLKLGTNASLVSYHSGLSAGIADLMSSALFAEGSVLQTSDLSVEADLTLSNSVASLGYVSLQQGGMLTADGGQSDALAVVMDADAKFLLAGGRLESKLCLNAVPDFPIWESFHGGVATFEQAGGQMSSDLIRFGERVISDNSQLISRRGQFTKRAGTLVSSRMEFLNGTFTQTGGASSLASVKLPMSVLTASGDFYLQAGTLTSGTMNIGYYDYFFPARGHFYQVDGNHTNVLLSLDGQAEVEDNGWNIYPAPAGFYSLSGGLLITDYLGVNGGSFVQTAGTNRAATVSVSRGGRYFLGGGYLVSSNCSMSGYESTLVYKPRYYPTLGFAQTGGVHRVEAKLTLGDLGLYYLMAGRLEVRDVEIGRTAELMCVAGSVSNWGAFRLLGEFDPGEQSQDFGRLELPGSTNAVIDAGGPRGSVIRFQDSSQALWNGSLLIVGWEAWTANGSSHHIFFGTNAFGLTQAQVRRVNFSDPLGWARGIYPARILETGEIVPAAPPLIAIARSDGGLVLSWPGDYLLFTATNVAGPYWLLPAAASPLTVPYSAPVQYFRLGLWQ